MSAPRLTALPYQTYDRRSGSQLSGLSRKIAPGQRVTVVHADADNERGIIEFAPQRGENGPRWAWAHLSELEYLQ